MLDRSLERGIITADEAGTFRDTFARIQAALSQGTRS